MRAPLRHPAHARHAIALIRVSKERDGTTSPDVQRHAIETYAAQHGITVIDWVEGIDESGSRRRSAWWARLDQAISRVEQHEADTIIVWKFSRVARNRLKWATALDRVDVAGGTLESATEPSDQSPAGEFQRGILGEMNQYQARLIGEGWKETHARRLREGKPATGRHRFGYIRDREADTYTIDEALAPTVRAMYTRAIDGNGLASITRWLNAEGHLTINGNQWQTIGVTRYMDRGFAAGLIWAGGTFAPGAHEPIIDQSTWEAYRARRASTARPPRGNVRMLSGLLRCGTCGGPMMAIRTSGDSGAYGCAARSRGGYCEAPATIERRLATAAVSAWVTGLQFAPDELRQADELERRQRAVTIEDRAALTRLIARAEERLSRLTMRLLDDKISQAAYDATAATLNAELDSLRLRHARTAPKPDVSLLTEIPKFAAMWEESDPAAQNRVARTLISRVIVSRGRGPQKLRIVPAWETRN